MGVAMNFFWGDTLFEKVLKNIQKILKKFIKKLQKGVKKIAKMDF